MNPLPCPFCGGVATLNNELREGFVPDEEGARSYFYVCDSCAAAGGWGKSESSALRYWNMRKAAVPS